MTAELEGLLAQLRRDCARGEWERAGLGLRAMQHRDPGHPLTSLGQGLLDLARGRFAEAESGFERAFAADPSLLEAGMALAGRCQARGHYLRAAAVIERALIRHPLYLPGWRSLVGLLQITGQSDILRALGQQLIDPDFVRRLPPDQRPAWAGWLPVLEALLLLNAFGADGATPQDLPPLLCRWRRHLGSRRPPVTGFPNSRDPDRRLRIGYVSGEWGSAPLELGFASLFAAQDPERFALYAYCDAGAPRDASPFAGIRATGELDDAGFYSRVQADAVDILIDLSGFFNPSRLLSLALKPAPLLLQGGANPPFATGLLFSDGFFSDALLMPPSLVAGYSERVLYLGSFFHWRPPAASPEPGPPMPEGVLRLGALASPNKLTPTTLRLWAGVLRALPGARLTLKHQAYSDPLLQERLRGRMVALGAPPGRIAFEDNHQRADYVSFLAEVDMLLDSYPYAGALSSCDALWMGVPVLSLTGGQRIADSLGHSLGLSTFLATDEADFIRIAVEHASPARLDPWRHGLRARLLASPICDAPRHARELEAACRALWHDWIARSELAE